MNRVTLKKAKLILDRNKKVIVDPCFVASTLWERTLGLMGEGELQSCEGLLLERSNSIHTFFMKFSIDAVFLDRNGRVVGIHKNIRPWKIDWPVLKARSVLELPGGAVDKLEIQKGDRLCIS